MERVEVETVEHNPAEEVVTQSADNVLLSDGIAGASSYFEDTGVTESKSESDIMKGLIQLLKNLKNDPISSMWFAGAFLLKQETEVNKQCSVLIWMIQMTLGILSKKV